jgi:hypothetical protein
MTAITIIIILGIYTAGFSVMVGILFGKAVYEGVDFSSTGSVDTIISILAKSLFWFITIISWITIVQLSKLKKGKMGG